MADPQVPEESVGRTALRLVRPDPGTLRAAAFLVAVVLVPGFIAQAIGGLNASVTVGLCSGAAMSFGTLMRARTAALVTLALGAAAAAGALVAGQPWLSGLAVALAILLTAPANAYSAGMLMMAPILTMVFAVTERGWPWWRAGLWGVIGGLVGLAIALLMRFGQRPPQPVDRALAWRHAIVLAVAAGLSIVAAELLDLDHGYWVTVTLLVVLRPVPGERRDYVRQRLAGTLLGAAVALVVVWLLPANLLLPAAFVFLVVLASYAMSGNYFMQTLFLTPMLLIFLSADGSGEVTVDLTVTRVAFTVVGVILAAGLAWALERWDERSGLVTA
ncbi:MAG TPA: FUSC family protein [Candidatus Nanopelagicales bacterium]